jgi:hypothetical protein
LFEIPESDKAVYPAKPTIPIAFSSHFAENDNGKK